MSSPSSSGAESAQARLAQAQSNVAMQRGPGLPNTLFDGYSQDELYNMFQENADPGAVQSQADAFKNVGNGLSDMADRIVQAMKTAQANWTGKAADSAMTTASGIVTWQGTLSGGSNAATQQVQTQSEALSAARAQVPKPVSEPSAWGAIGHAFTEGPAAAYNNYENQKQAASDAKAAQVQAAQQYDGALDSTSAMPQFNQNPTSTTPGGDSGSSAGTTGGGAAGGGGTSYGGYSAAARGGAGGGYAAPAGSGYAASPSVPGSGAASGVSAGGTSTSGAGGGTGGVGEYGGGYSGGSGGWGSGSQGSQDAAAAAGMMPPMAVGGGGFAGAEDTYSAGRGYGGSTSGSYGGSAGSAGSGSGSGAGARSGAVPGGAAAGRAAAAAGAAEAKAAGGSGMAGGGMGGARGRGEEDEEHETASYLVNDDNMNDWIGKLPPTAPPVIS